MSLLEQWSLKDKNGNPPPPQIIDFIKKLDKKNLLPCPRSADDLQMPEKETAPREMNSFIVFRRQLAYVAKFQKTSDDGRVISTAASYIWNGASKSEKASYTRIAEELKMRHRKKYPNYTYERRKRKSSEEDFINYKPHEILQNKSKKKRKPSPESTTRNAQHVPEEQKAVSISTISQENNDWLNSLTNNNPYYGIDCYPSENYHNGQAPPLTSEEYIPQLYQSVISTNYVSLTPQESLQQQQSLYNYTPTWEFEIDQNLFLNGNSDAGINQSIYEGLERPIDDYLLPVFLLN